MIRSNGISTLIACQNEEATVGWCIRSFLDFSDEIIVVDNGSTDASKEICRELQRQFPEKVRFYDVPLLKDLYENRQYALERSRYRWIVRADADYVCYTSGKYDCKLLREQILARRVWHRPSIYWLYEPRLYGDFWHTGTPVDDAARGPAGCGVRRRMPVVSKPNPRIYQWLPGMRFSRLGRMEGMSIPRRLRRLFRKINWPMPIWMECNVKSEHNMLYRSERTNWRELGDFERYPDLDSLVRERAREQLGVEQLEEAASAYAQEHVYPHLTKYDPERGWPYPELVQWAMQHSPVYQIARDQGHMSRHYLGVNYAAFDAINCDGS